MNIYDMLCTDHDMVFIQSLQYTWKQDHFSDKIFYRPRSVCSKSNGIIKEKLTSNLLLFICLLVWGLSSHSRMYHSHGDLTIASEGLQILTNA